MCIAIENLNIHQPDGNFQRGTLYVAGGRFVAPVDSAARVDGKGMLAIPGLIDIHTHGRAGFDFCEADGAALRKMAADYAATGVTALLPTLASDTTEGWKKALDVIGNSGEKAFLGVHMEGCWLAAARRGAHAESLLRDPAVAELEELVAASPLPIRRISLAPELDPDGSFLAACRAHGIATSIGHTDADYDTAMLAISRGATAFTHLFNAMPPLHHRAGGPVAAALTEPDVFAELICDGKHIAPEMVRLIYRCKGTEGLVLITDSMAGTGCADGQYPIAGQMVTLKDGTALTADGKLAGSTLNLLQGVQNLATFCRIPFGEAVLCATATPAAALGLAGERGTLAVGAVADLVLLESEAATRPARVMRGGEWLDG